MYWCLLSILIQGRRVHRGNNNCCYYGYRLLTAYYMLNTLLISTTLRGSSKISILQVRKWRLEKVKYPLQGHTEINIAGMSNPGQHQSQMQPCPNQSNAVSKAERCNVRQKLFLALNVQPIQLWDRGRSPEQWSQVLSLTYSNDPGLQGGERQHTRKHFKIISLIKSTNTYWAQYQVSREL